MISIGDSQQSRLQDCFHAHKLNRYATDLSLVPMWQIALAGDGLATWVQSSA
jgi:hypothetical protein